MRPPFGARNHRIDAVARQLGMPEILWNVDTMDWRYPDSSRLTNTVLTSARPGLIVLMHDAINRSTITAMPAIIDQLHTAASASLPCHSFSVPPDRPHLSPGHPRLLIANPNTQLNGWWWLSAAGSTAETRPQNGQGAGVYGQSWKTLRSTRSRCP